MEAAAQVQVEDVPEVHQVHPGGGNAFETQLEETFPVLDQSSLKLG